MAKSEKKYVATRGISFEGLKPVVHCEPGDPIPEKVDAATIADLLSDQSIKEAQEEE